MQPSHLMGVGALLATALLFGVRMPDAPPAAATQAVLPPAPPPTPTPPRADGHYVMVVEGDRNALDITFASRKPSPWAGVPKGFTSDWRLTVRDANGAALAEVPLDVRPFATRRDQVGQPVEVRGCIVVDARIRMLVNVPAFATAASYGFSRRDPDGRVVPLGTVAAARLAERTGGGK